MANIKAKEKNIPRIELKNARNRHIKSKVKTAIRKAKESVTKRQENATQLVELAHKEINKAVSKGVIHKNNGARKESNLDKFVNKQKETTKQA